MLSCLEICAGAGGQALGLEMAGFSHIALVEYESDYCAVLKANRPEWNVICEDVRQFDGTVYKGIDLLAAGIPCPPFSIASKQLGEHDERDLFPSTIRLIGEIRPRAVMIENVRGFLDKKFDDYRTRILSAIENLGYDLYMRLISAADFGVSQMRLRVIIIGISKSERQIFHFPQIDSNNPPTVGELLKDLMGENNWKGTDNWVETANGIAPTLVGGSKKHGGPDLGPVRARRAWANLGVDGKGIANSAPDEDFEGMPRLTKEMLARLQGFPSHWHFGLSKTKACRMIGNAFPPPVAKRIGDELRRCLENEWMH